VRITITIIRRIRRRGRRRRRTKEFENHSGKVR
jgi:hypothetical protein